MSDPFEIPLSKMFDHLLSVISSEKFLKMQGLGNEVPFFICPYSPSQYEEIGTIYRALVKQLRLKGIRVVELNLYDLCIELLKSSGEWTELISNELTLSKDELKEYLQGTLDPEKILCPAILDTISSEDYDVLFLRGAGEIYPYIRTHTILNNLQSKVKNHPLVMFFPGEYRQNSEEGASLQLFGKLEDDKYYRAFNILKYHA